MKIRVIKPFTDKMFNDEILRKVGDIIDTDDESFKCDEELAKTRIKHKVCEEVKKAKVANTTTTKRTDVPTTEGIDVVTTYSETKTTKKGKKEIDE